MSIVFLLTTLVVVATPGTGAVYSIAAGLSRGSRAGIIAAFGCTLGVLPHMVAAITGLAAILHASAIAFPGVQVARGRLPGVYGDPAVAHRPARPARTTRFFDR